jgi:hypothetical protein
MGMQDDVETPDGIDLDDNVNMEIVGDNADEEDEEKDDEEEEEDDEDEVEDEDADDGEEPQIIGQGEMVNTLADNVDTIVADEPIMLP